VGESGCELTDTEKRKKKRRTRLEKRLKEKQKKSSVCVQDGLAHTGGSSMINIEKKRNHEEQCGVYQNTVEESVQNSNGNGDHVGGTGSVIQNEEKISSQINEGDDEDKAPSTWGADFQDCKIGKMALCLWESEDGKEGGVSLYNVKGIIEDSKEGWKMFSGMQWIPNSEVTETTNKDCLDIRWYSSKLVKQVEGWSTLVYFTKMTSTGHLPKQVRSLADKNAKFKTGIINIEKNANHEEKGGVYHNAADESAEDGNCNVDHAGGTDSISHEGEKILSQVDEDDDENEEPKTWGADFKKCEVGSMALCLWESEDGKESILY
jgi:hypothetical protein